MRGRRLSKNYVLGGDGMNETGQVKIRNPLTIITRKNWLILIGLLLLLTAVGV